MKNSQEMPKAYREAINSGNIEFASSDQFSPGRTSCIRFLNAINGLESAGVNIPVGVALDPDDIIKKVEARGINVPFVSLFNDKGETSIQSRNFTDSFKGVDWSDILQETGPAKRKLSDKEMQASIKKAKDYLKNKEVDRMADRGFFVDGFGTVHPLFK
jgi:hypothetical protein